MDAGGAAELDPVDELVKGHFVFHLDRLDAFVERDDAVPGVADEAEFEVALELTPADVDLALLWEEVIKRTADPVRSPPKSRPRIFHQRFDLNEIEMRNVSLAQNCADAGRAGLGHLDEDAFVFV